MNKKFVNFIVKKYLKFDKTQPFISVSFILAFLGIATGVGVLIIAMSIMNGMDEEFEKKLTIMNYPLTIYSQIGDNIDEKFVKRLEIKYPNLKFSPYIQTSAIIKNRQMNGVILYGVDFKKEKEINPIFSNSTKDNQFRKFDIVVGKRLFDNMGINKKDKVVMIFSNADPYGIEVAPRLKKVRIVSYFHSGLNAYDKGIAYMNIEGLKIILRQKNYTGIHIYSKHPFKDIKKLKKDLPFGVGIIGWWQQNGNFFSALKLEKRAMFLVLMLIIIVASLNIIGSLLMMIMNRRKEIALMMSLGASKKEIKAIFFRLGMVVGFFGIIAGISLGGFGIWVLNTFDIISLPADVYGTSKIPTDLSLVDFCLIIIGAVVVIMLSSFYPAKKASEVDILTTLRFE
jgi:putative ABC transport system permease protein